MKGKNTKSFNPCELFNIHIMITKDSHGSQQNSNEKQSYSLKPQSVFFSSLVLDFFQHQFQQTMLTLKKKNEIMATFNMRGQSLLSIQIKLKDVQP